MEKCQVCKKYDMNKTPIRKCVKCGILMCRYCFEFTHTEKVYCKKCAPV